jgi:hypothetical protein
MVQTLPPPAVSILSNAGVLLQAFISGQNDHHVDCGILGATEAGGENLINEQRKEWVNTLAQMIWIQHQYKDNAGA